MMSSNTCTTNPYHGWVVINKPLHTSSTDVVRIVRRIFKTRKVGHAGTLDPLATGVLPIAVGEATKTVSYAMNTLKDYQFTVKWGTATSTDDCEGVVTKQSDMRPTLENIQYILPQFTGHVQQTPPIYSAIRINGERAYALARQGKEIKMQPRQVYIQNIECTKITDNNTTCFKVRCGKGVYIRSIARDMGELLACYGHVVHLERTQSASFSLEESISLEKLQNLRHKEAVFADMYPVARGLADIPAFAVTSDEVAALQQGKQIMYTTAQTAETAWAYAYSNADNIPIAIGIITENIFSPKRVFKF